VQTVLYPVAKAILPRLTTRVLSKAENLGCFYDPPGIDSHDAEVVVDRSP